MNPQQSSHTPDGLKISLLCRETFLSSCLAKVKGLVGHKRGFSAGEIE